MNGNYGKFRSRQIVVEAIRFTAYVDTPNLDDMLRSIQHFTSTDGKPALRVTDHPASLLPELQVYDKLHDSWIKVLPGQWIIKGTKGEFYPCDDEVLQQKYEDVTNVDLSAMDFGAALKAAKEGAKIARKNWNAKDQYVYYVEAAKYPAVTEVAKKEFALVPSSVGPNNEIMVPYTAYMAIKTVQNTVAPWLASQTDMLADDWFVVK